MRPRKVSTGHSGKPCGDMRTHAHFVLTARATPAAPGSPSSPCRPASARAGSSATKSLASRSEPPVQRLIWSTASGAVMSWIS